MNRRNAVKITAGFLAGGGMFTLAQGFIFKWQYYLNYAQHHILLSFEYKL